MTKRRVSNPLALAVLACLFERAMHPYEMVGMLKHRGKERSIRINYGSLYTVIDSLVRADFIKSVETFRVGRRPERTVYALTPAGRMELRDWLRSLLREPEKQYPEFEAGLSLMLALPPDEVFDLLQERTDLLVDRIAEVQGNIDRLIAEGVWRIFIIEADYECALLRAELDWVRNLIRALKEEPFEDLAAWRHFHERAEAEEEEIELREGPPASFGEPAEGR